MEIFNTYPTAFLVTVVLPLITGVILSIGGYSTLKARAKSDIQLNRIEENSNKALEQMSNVNGVIATLNHYENNLAKAGARDNVLSAVLAQYKKMKNAAEQWEKFRGAKSSEKHELATEVLATLSSSLSPVTVRDDLPSNPLILNQGNNTFHVLFSVPMIIPPRLEFNSLPNGTTAKIIENSKFGFTAQFSPLKVEVSSFGFTADAEL